jgi:hypothetical protein
MSFWSRTYQLCSAHLPTSVTGLTPPRPHRSSFGSLVSSATVPASVLDDVSLNVGRMSGLSSSPREFATGRPSEEDINRIVDAYLTYDGDAFSGVNSNTNPLHWWHDHNVLFPYLAPVARRLLSCQASSAIIERVFAQAKHWVRDERNSTSDETLDHCASLCQFFRGLSPHPSRLDELPLLHGYVAHHHGPASAALV